MAEDKKKRSISKGRRDALKTLATIPVLGAMAYGYIKIKTNVRNVWQPICSVLRKNRFRRLLSMGKRYG